VNIDIKTIVKKHRLLL